MSKKKVYFARSIDMYETPIDYWRIKNLKELGFEVIDPNEFFDKDQYEKQGMTLFFEKIEECDLFIYALNRDGDMTAGVTKEYSYAFNNGIMCLQIPCLSNVKTLDITETRNYLKRVGAR